MPPTEAALLRSYLLSHVELPDIITEEQFIDLFPRSQQSHPQIPILYRELENQRAIVTDEIERNIAAEVKRGERQWREVMRARRKAEAEPLGPQGKEGKRELELEVGLLGPTSTFRTSKPHTLQSIVREMGEACRDLEVEIEESDIEAEVILTDLKETVAGLSAIQASASASTRDKQNGADVLQDLARLEELFDRIGAER